MRVVKKISSDSAAARLLSRSFESVMKERNLPLPVTYVELDIPGSTYTKNDKMYLGINSASNLLADNDRRLAKILVRFETFRALVKRLLDREMPQDIEDLLVAREMMKRGYTEDIVYLFYTYVMQNSARDTRSLLKFIMVEALFSGHDKFYETLFKDIIKTKAAERGKLEKSFLLAAKKDLLQDSNLDRVIKIYGEILDAGY